MPTVRPNASARWSTRANAATPDYKAGVQNPRTPWQAATTAAAPAWTSGVQSAIQNGSFQKGVAASSDAIWAAAASTKGADRYGTGVAAGQINYANGVAKYTQVIQNTQLPPRGPKGDPRNFQRVVVMATALRNAKLGK
jgi:hypothetical protein